MADISKRGLNLSLPLSVGLMKTHQTLLCHIKLVSSDGVPRRLGGKVGSDEERKRPDPLEEEGKSPAHVSLDAGYSTDDTTGEKNTGAPTHANVGGDVGSKNSRNNFGGVSSGKSLFRHAHVSFTSLTTSKLESGTNSPGKHPKRHHTSPHPMQE
jgi:hypothetical protein